MGARAGQGKSTKSVESGPYRPGGRLHPNPVARRRPEPTTLVTRATDPRRVCRMNRASRPPPLPPLIFRPTHLLVLASRRSRRPHRPRRWIHCTGDRPRQLVRKKARNARETERRMAKTLFSNRNHRSAGESGTGRESGVGGGAPSRGPRIFAGTDANGPEAGRPQRPPLKKTVRHGTPRDARHRIGDRRSPGGGGGRPDRRRGRYPRFTQAPSPVHRPQPFRRQLSSEASPEPACRDRPPRPPLPHPPLLPWDPPWRVMMFFAPPPPPRGAAREPDRLIHMEARRRDSARSARGAGQTPRRNGSHGIGARPTKITGMKRPGAPRQNSP